MKKLILFVFLLNIFGSTSGQSIIDTLLNQLDTAKNGEFRLVLISDMVKHTIFSDTDSSWFYIEKYEAEAVAQNKDLEVARGKNFKAIFHSMKGNNALAIEYYLEALKEFKIQKDTAMVGMMYNNIASAYEINEEFQQSLNYFEKGLEYFVAAKSEEWTAHCIYNIGVMHRHLGNYDQALIQYQDAMVINKKLGDNYGLSTSISGIGYVHLSKKEYEEAIPYFEEGIALSRNHSDKVNLINNLMALCECYVFTGQLEKAEKVLAEGKELAFVLDNPNSTKEISLGSFLVAKGRGDFEGAIEHLTEYHRIKDELSSEKKAQQLNDILTKYETKEKESRLVVQELELAQKSKRNTFLLILTIIIGSSLILLIYFSLNKIKTNKLLEQQKEIIQKALDQKSILLKEIHHRVKNNLQIVSSLLSIQSRNIQDVAALEAVEESKNRVKSMALIHQNLYTEENLTGIKTNEYIEKLCKSLFNSYKVDHDNIICNTDIEELNLDVDTVIPLGLILNELITNALKYAFPDNRKGELLISLKELGDKLELSVADNGVGMDAARLDPESTSFGVNMINVFATKLEAKIQVKSEVGTEVKMQIGKYKKIA